MKLETGKIVTAAALRKEFGPHFDAVLGSEYLTRQPHKKRHSAKFEIKQMLPTKEEYAALQDRRFATTVGDLISDGYGEVQALAEEMQEAFDNMPEGLQNGDVGQRREQAASTLGDISEPEVPEACAKIPVVFIPFLPPEWLTNRSKRASDAAGHLQAAATAIRDHFEAAEGDDNSPAHDADEALELADQLESDASEIEGVEFPGMCG